MSRYNYTFQGYDEAKMAHAVGISLPISPKQAVEICNYLKHRSIKSAKAIIARVREMKQAIPFKRFNKNVGHKPGIAAGRYPQHATREILKLIASAEANAHNKGIIGELYISHMNAHRAPPQPRSGRTPGEAKRAHVEITVMAQVEENITEKKKAVSSKGTKVSQ